VAPAPVYINGGGYYERRPYYDGGRPYYGRPAYPAVRPGYPAARPPNWGGGRPPVAVRPPVAGGVPAQPRGNARFWTSPDSKTQTPP
jgi:hypothetical protein